MARKSKNRSRNPYIIIFWEGESEEQYFKFLKDRFHEKANLNIHNKKGLFAVADKAFSAKGIYMRMMFWTWMKSGLYLILRSK